MCTLLLGWVDFGLFAPLSAIFCLCRWKFGRASRATGQHGGKAKSKYTRHSAVLPYLGRSGKEGIEDQFHKLQSSWKCDSSRAGIISQNDIYLAFIMSCRASCAASRTPTGPERQSRER